MRRFRIWLSTKAFQFGKWVHPEIAELERKIKKAQDEMDMFDGLYYGE